MGVGKTVQQMIGGDTAVAGPVTELTPEKIAQAQKILESGQVISTVPGSGPTIEHCAMMLLEWISGLDPAWDTRLQIMRDERGLDAKQALGACVGYVLDNQLHMIIPNHPAFDGTGWKAGPTECLVCRKVFTPQYAGQRALCSNECARSLGTASAQA